MIAFGESSEVATGANKVLVRAQQCVGSEPDAHPVVTAGIEMTFTNESSVSLLVEKIGEIMLGTCIHTHAHTDK